MVARALVATTTAWVRNPGPGIPQLLITEGDSHDADSPIVKAYPWAFGTPEDIVEAATAAPGEKRRTKRTKK